MTTDALLAVISAFVLAFLLPYPLGPILTRLGALDVPNARSSHQTPVLRGGGIAQAGSLLIVVGVAALSADRDRAFLASVVAVVVGTAALGATEDLAGVPITVRAASEFAIGAVAMLVAITGTDEPLWWLIIGGVAVLALVNVVNFMDGVNGISALHGIVGGGAFAVIGSLYDEQWLVVSGLALAGAFAAFLPWNLSGRMFLGDAGSYLLGGTLGTLIVLGWVRGLPIVALAAPMTIYVADTGVTLVGRIARGDAVHVAHRDHTYQRLNRVGFSHLRVSLSVVLGSSVCAAAGIGVAQSTGPARAGYWIVIGVVLAAYTSLRFSLGNTLRQGSPPHQ